MRLTVLGGAGAWPPAGGACSGYLIEHGDERLLVDPGYATLPRLLQIVPVESIDAVFISHGHPDHVADLNPLLRARAMADEPSPSLPIYALPGALRAVVALDRPGMLDDAYELVEFTGGESLQVGSFEIQTRMLPHSLPNAGVRFTVDGRSITYTGDAGPTGDLVELAAGIDLLLAEATHVDLVPDDAVGLLNSALEAGRQATQAKAKHLVLTHLWPGTDRGASRAAAARSFDDRIDVAAPGIFFDLR